MAHSSAEPGALLVVRAGGRRLGLPARLVRRIVRDLGVTPVPGSTPRFAGLAQIGGEPVPVVDLGVELGTAEPTAALSRLAVVVELSTAADRTWLALAVDEAIDLVSPPTAAGESADGGGPGLEVYDPSCLVVRG